jgi:hypothetical protein
MQLVPTKLGVSVKRQYVTCSLPFLINKKRKFSSYGRKIQTGSVAKSEMRKGFLIFEEMRKYVSHMRRPLVIYDFATAPV